MPVLPSPTALPLAAALGGLWIVSLVTVALAFPHGTPTSSDPGAPAIPVWVTILPPLVGIALALALPGRRPALAVSAVNARPLLLTTIVLLGCAVAFPVAVGLVPLQGENYVLGKFVLLMLVPALTVLTIRGAVRLEVPRAAWRWWAPAIAVAAWAWLALLAPWIPQHDLSGYDTELLVVAAVATAVTAGLGEELFYRRWLQTRLEALLGPWLGIALASLAFAFMHLGSHGTGNLPLDVARVIAAQGSFGLFMGVLWWRYRNLTLVVLAHLLVNGWGPAVEILHRLS
nr:CPBP family intramembrane glutamic endopeptidase [Kineosphaera limosa]